MRTPLVAQELERGAGQGHVAMTAALAAHPQHAARGVERIVQWWAVNRPAAPGAVRQDLQAALNLLLVQPDIGIRVKEALTRRAALPS